MRRNFSFLVSLVALAISAEAKLPFGGPKQIPVNPDGTVAGEYASAEMGMGGYLKGAKKIVVPLVAVAFESTAKASVTRSSGGGSTIKSKSLETHLVIDEKALQSLADEMQKIVEADLAAQGFEVLPQDSLDQDARVAAIAKNEKIGIEVGDNFLSGFGGNGTYNKWFTAGQRPLFGTGATGALSETSALVHTARDTGKTLLFYRFKVQYTEVDAKNNILFSDVKGKNLLHIASADLTVFTPANTLGSMLKLKADITAGADYVKEVRDLPANPSEWKALNLGAAFDSLINGNINTTTKSKASGHYAIVADEAKYTADSRLLLSAVSKQFAAALKRSQ